MFFSSLLNKTEVHNNIVEDFSNYSLNTPLVHPWKKFLGNMDGYLSVEPAGSDVTFPTQHVKSSISSSGGAMGFLYKGVSSAHNIKVSITFEFDTSVSSVTVIPKGMTDGNYLGVKVSSSGKVECINNNGIKKSTFVIGTIANFKIATPYNITLYVVEDVLYTHIIDYTGMLVMHTKSTFEHYNTFWKDKKTWAGVYFSGANSIVRIDDFAVANNIIDCEDIVVKQPVEYSQSEFSESLAAIEPDVWYRFDDDPESKFVWDSSDNKIHGVWNSGTRMEQSMVPSESELTNPNPSVRDAKIYVPDKSILTKISSNDFSVGAFINIDTDIIRPTHIFSYTGTLLATPDGKLLLQWYEGTKIKTLLTHKIFELGETYFVGMEVDCINLEVRFYVDGVLASTLKLQSPIPRESSTLRDYSGLVVGAFKGQIDEVFYKIGNLGDSVWSQLAKSASIYNEKAISKSDMANSDVMQQSPIVYWPLSELTGNIACNVTENKYDGHYHNKPSFGQSPLIFSGTSVKFERDKKQYIDVSAFRGDYITQGKEFTIIAFAKPEIQSKQMAILGNINFIDDTTTDSGIFLGQYGQNGQLRFTVSTDHGLLFDAKVPNFFTVSETVCITVTRRGNVVIVYKNDKVAAVTHKLDCFTDESKTNDKTLTISRSDSVANDYWDGQLDHIAFLDKSLTDVEVNMLYNSLTHGYSVKFVDVDTDYYDNTDIDVDFQMQYHTGDSILGTEWIPGFVIGSPTDSVVIHQMQTKGVKLVSGKDEQYQLLYTPKSTQYNVTVEAVVPEISNNAALICNYSDTKNYLYAGIINDGLNIYQRSNGITYPSKHIPLDGNIDITKPHILKLESNNDVITISVLDIETLEPIQTRFIKLTRAKSEGYCGIHAYQTSATFDTFTIY